MNKVVVEKGRPFNIRKATTDHLYNIAIGSSEAHIAINLVNKDNFIAIEIYISNNKELYDKLYSYKDEIEEKLGLSLEWLRLDNKKASCILTYIGGLDFNNHDNYPKLINESIDIVIKMKNVFSAYIK